MFQQTTRPGLALRRARITRGRSLLLAAVLAIAAAGSQAAPSPIFDSLAGKRSQGQCIACPGQAAFAEIGDIITFSGTERSLTTVMLGLSQTSFAGLNPYAVDVQLSLFNVDGSLQTSFIASRTTHLSISKSGQLNVPFDFTGVVVPDTLYYGVSIPDADGTAAHANANALHLALWDFHRNADGLNLPAGSDPGTVELNVDFIQSTMYFRNDTTRPQLSASNGFFIMPSNLPNSGTTPAISFQANAVPEPASLALALAGLAALRGVARRRRPPLTR